MLLNAEAWDPIAVEAHPPVAVAVQLGDWVVLLPRAMLPGVLPEGPRTM